ncbi:hypothetical protein CCP1ISM_20009 [Azospirillaceae bacterium]
MNKRIKDDITRVLQKEYLRRSLIEYFKNKGYTKTFEICPYPPSLQDMNEQAFASKAIEVAYNIEDIDLIDNAVKISWNIFVLGNKRIFLGYTNHQNFSDIQNNRNIIADFNGPINIDKIINTIVEFLGNSTTIYDINKKTMKKFNNRPMLKKY